LCRLRLVDGTALAMIHWLAALPQWPLIVAVAADEGDSLLVEALRAGADNPCIAGAGAESLLVAVNQTLRGETTLSTPMAHALLDHFERMRTPRANALSVGDEQSPLQPNRRSAVAVPWPPATGSSKWRRHADASR
jgi:DNA-binding NarL/FixJ family response regulator